MLVCLTMEQHGPGSEYPWPRHDHGLARNGWTANNTRTPRRRPMEIPELRLERRERGWARHLPSSYL